jgi:hypothetical protein
MAFFFGRKKLRSQTHAASQTIFHMADVSGLSMMLK